MSFSRRGFLGFAAGAAAGSVVGGYGGSAFSKLTASLDLAVYPPGGPETWALSICRECPGGCGLRVRSIGGKPVKVDGNPLHPVSGGRLCPKGQATLQALYHPDRIRTPLRRVGARGDLGSFRPASWDEALEEIGQRLSMLRQQGRPEALALLRGPSSSLDGRLASSFLRAFGSPNDIGFHPGMAAPKQAAALTQGVAAEPVFDLKAADLALSFGSDLLEASASPVYAARAYGDFRRGRGGRRGRLVHFGPRLSLTASAADEWVPVRAGSEGVMALGIAGVLVAEGLHDKEFVARRVQGFEDEVGADGGAVLGLRKLLRRDFSLERVAAETGVSVNRILRIAREFAAARPGLAVGPRRGNLLPVSLLDHLGAQVLNALGGNIDGPGGLLTPEEVPLPAWPAAADDPIAAAGLARPRLDQAGARRADPTTFAESVVRQDPYRAEALFLLDADPVFASTSPELFATALAQIPLVVCFAALPDDTGLLSDWILPPPHSLEAWGFDLRPTGVPFPLASLAAPVLSPPLHEVRPVGEVFLDLARRLGGPVAGALPWPDLPTLIRAEVAGLFQAQRGAVIGTPFDEAWVRLMERAGWWAPGYRTEEELWTRIQETGGWWDPFYDHHDWKRVLPTDSGRFQLCPGQVAELDQHRRARELAHSERAQRDAGPSASLALHLFEPLPMAGGRGAELPFLQEILDPGHQEKWRTWVEINPETAHSLELLDGAWVEVRSPHGAITARAQVTERVVPGVAAVPVGLGRGSGGRWARSRGANPLRLLSPSREAVSGLPDLGATRVRITAARGPGHGGRSTEDQA